MRHSPLGDASPLVQLERAAPTLTYSVVIVVAVIAIGLGGAIAAWSAARAGGSWLGSSLWFVAVSTLIFSSSMAVAITLSLSRRLRVLAEAAQRLAHQSSVPAIARTPKTDPLTSLAHSLTYLAERGAALSSELEQCLEEQQARVDALVRERTRALARESEDCRRLLGDGKGVLTLDREGRVLSQSTALESWLGSMPRTGQFWEYFERASAGAGLCFESAWQRAMSASSSTDLAGMPDSLRVGDRHLALEYKGVFDSRGKLDRMLVLLTDVTIPAPDPATSSLRG